MSIGFNVSLIFHLRLEVSARRRLLVAPRLLVWTCCHAERRLSSRKSFGRCVDKIYACFPPSPPLILFQCTGCPRAPHAYIAAYLPLFRLS